MLRQETAGYFHRRPKPTTAGHTSINRTHDSEDFFDKLQAAEGREQYLKQRYREQRTKTRQSKLLSDSTSFSMKRLKQTIVKLRSDDLQNNRFRWVSPMTSHKKNRCYAVTETDFIANGKTEESQPHQSTRQLHKKQPLGKINLCSNLIGCGEYLRSCLPNKERRNRSGVWRTNISTLSKLTQQYEQLERASRDLKGMVPLVVASHELRNRLDRPDKGWVYRSRVSNFSSDDPLKIAFHDCNEFFQQNFRRDDVEIMKRLLSSLCGYGRLDIHSFLRFNSLFVTKEATLEQKVELILQLFFEEEQTQMPFQQYCDLLKRIVKDSRKLAGQRLDKLYSSILRITTESTGPLYRSNLKAVLTDNPDIAQVLLSLLLVT